MRILVVDDEPMIIAGIRRILSETGHEILEAQSPNDAIEVIRTERLDVAIIDYDLKKGLTGIDVANHTARETVPIYLSGLPSRIVRPRIEMKVRQFFAVLEKPIDKAKLLNALDRIQAMKEPTSR